MLDAQRTGSGGLAKLGEGVRANSDAKTQAGLTRGPNLSKKLINAAWTDTFPAQGATLDLDFANDRGFVRGIGQGRSMDAVTFTRASNGTYVNEQGLLVTHANQGALGNNLLTFPQDFDNAVWSKLALTVEGNFLRETTATSAHLLFRATFDLADAVIYCDAKANGRNWLRIGTRQAVGARSAYFDLASGAVGTVNVGITAAIEDRGGGVYRCYVYGPMVANASGLQIGPTSGNNVTSHTGDDNLGVFVYLSQVESGTVATEYFPTNIGQPRFDWASTASTGAGTIADPRIIPLAANPTSNGLLIEEARTNRILWCRDATQANWVKTNVTAAKDQTGVDGVANAASSLTATANDGTCIQTITLASGSRTGSVYLKRITGTGNVQVSLDGTTYSTVDLSTTEWRRIVLSGTVTNPTVGIKLAVSGDAVAMDYGQVEDGAFPTSPILTTTATATRAVDTATIDETNVVCFYNNGFLTWNMHFKGISNSRGISFFSLAGPATTALITTNGLRFSISNTVIDAIQFILLGGVNISISSITNAGRYQPFIDLNLIFSSNTSSCFSAVNNQSFTSAISNNHGISTNLNRLRIFGARDTTAFSGYIKRLTYAPKFITEIAGQEWSAR
jgi:hypothetical protein